MQRGKTRAKKKRQKNNMSPGRFELSTSRYPESYTHESYENMRLAL